MNRLLKMLNFNEIDFYLTLQLFCLHKIYLVASMNMSVLLTAKPLIPKYVSLDFFTI